MRVLFTTTGHSGHLLPLVPLAEACQRAGHDIAIATHASRTAAVERVGLPAHAVEEAPEAAWAPLMSRLPRLRQADADALIIAEGFARTAGRAALPGVLDVVDEFMPDVLVHECYEFAGPIAAESRGIASARVALGLTSTEVWVSDLAARTVGRRRPSPLLSMVPPGLDDGPAFRFRDGTPPAAPPLPTWWANAQEPLVYVTFGSVTGSLAFFPALYRDALEALGSLPIRVLLTIGRDADPAALGPLPPNAHVAPWVAQHEVLPHAAAVVSHGGYGTTLGALAHGVPLVLLPLFAGDQWRTARRVAQVGAGLLLQDGERRTFDPPGPRLMAALPGALRRVVGDPRFARTARHVGREMARLPPARAAVGVLEAAAHARARSAGSWLAGASGAPAHA